MEVASKVILSHTSPAASLRNVLQIHGGAGAALGAAAAAAAVSVASESSTLSLTGGASDCLNNTAIARVPPLLPTSIPAGGGGESILGVSVPPEGKAVGMMAIAMAFHYLGYSLARPITIALFSSSSTGYAGFAAAFPFAMAFVSPAALLLLMLYGELLKRGGPRGALKLSTVFSALAIGISALAIVVFERTKWTVAGIPAAKLVTGPLFVFRESYVQLLTSQYWSFAASVLTPSQSARWFGPIAGLTSMTSAVAGILVKPLVNRVGLAGVLMGTALFLVASLIWSSSAYAVADQYGFSPKESSSHSKFGAAKKANGSSKGDDNDAGLFRTAVGLFARVPVLGALFVEILASQGLATVLNVCFVACLGSTIPDDAQRAGWVGIFYTITNVITMVLQFGILPPFMSAVEPRYMWRAIPIIPLLFTAFQTAQRDPSLYVVSASLMSMKVTEYSARRMLDEMVFVPLDYESRFVGKEVIGVFGYRLGKSLTSLFLSGLTAIFGASSGSMRQLSIASSAVALMWCGSAWKLSSLVPTRKEAEEQHKKTKQGK